MKKILLLISFLLLITSCSLNNNEEELNNKISKLELEKQELIERNNELLLQINLQNNNSEVFDNNLKCIWYKEDVMKYIDKYLKMTLLDSSNLKWDTKIFFSPKTNSCLFTIWTVLDYDNKMNYSFRIFEYGTENELVMNNYSCDLFQCKLDKANEMEKIIENYR